MIYEGTEVERPRINLILVLTVITCLSQLPKAFGTEPQAGLPSRIDSHSEGLDVFLHEPAFGLSNSKTYLKFLSDGQRLTKTDQPGMAVLPLGKAIETGVKDSRAYWLRGYCFYQLGDFELALLDFNKVVELGTVGLPKGLIPVLYRYRADLHLALHHNDQALQDIETAISMCPNYVAAYSDRGTIFLALHKPGQAVLDFSKAIELEPSKALSYSNRAAALIEIGKLQDALLDLDKAIRLAPTDGSNYLARAKVYDQLGDKNSASRDYYESVRLKTTRPRSEITVRTHY